jgi:hypothetical protein
MEYSVKQNLKELIFCRMEGICFVVIINTDCMVQRRLPIGERRIPLPRTGHVREMKSYPKRILNRNKRKYGSILRKERVEDAHEERND